MIQFIFPFINFMIYLAYLQNLDNPISGTQMYQSIEKLITID